MTSPAFRLRILAERWTDAPASERANAQSYLIELCHALGVEPPRPAGTGYEFELDVRLVDREGRETLGRIDLWKQDHFALEAKDHEAGRSTDALLQKAFGQVRNYVAHVSGSPPPYLMVLDVGKTLLLWDRWTGAYGGFNAAHRIDLATLADRPEDIELLRDVWQNPSARDPRARSVAVTTEIAGKLGELAASLEGRGHDPERVARFLMRCVFTMFAEDVALLPDEPFRRIIDELALANPDEFPGAAEALWRAMDEGSRFGMRKLLRFNGHFFREVEALPLTREDLGLLAVASAADWQHVEPSIFGTLLVRALDPAERHRLGAEFTPRAYIERLVRPTVEEPIREKWIAVQAEVLQLRESGKKRDKAKALERLREFHAWLRGLRFLDPACGSGNFLYVTLHMVKRIELEVIRAIEEVTGEPALRIEEVGPWQFHGIEIKPWAREIAELTLWIGFHQFWRAHHDVQPPEPILRDTGTIECRDAVLAWDEIVEVPEKSRPDPTPRIRHQVTGELVPDPEARLPYYEYSGARQAEWPRADFIVGNPPYLGQARQRDAFGDGYVDALRATYDTIPHSADFVMYWWFRAATEIAQRRAVRAGLITTNTIVQSQNRVVVAAAATTGAAIMWAIPDHPWVDEIGSADVRVAMVVIGFAPERVTRLEVDDAAEVVRETQHARFNADLSCAADLTSAVVQRLVANQGLASRGFQLIGAGFILQPDEAEALLAADSRHQAMIRPYLHGRDLTSRPRGLRVIDFGTKSVEEARATPLLFQLISDRVKPSRDANNDRSTRTYWWRFGRNREDLREALSGLDRYIATSETSKHRFFAFLPAAVAPDNMLVCVALSEAFALGVLSSSIHVAWALSAGGRLGVGNDPRYNKTVCFDPFPFPGAIPSVRSSIEQRAEQLDAHRADALARDERVTMTGMYNVVEMLRSGEPLTSKERTIHELAACGVLRDMHDELDALVAEAYGWPWPMEREEILERLVALHDERVREEQAGLVRWLRPEYQIPRFGRDLAPPPEELDLPATSPAATPSPAAAPAAEWPVTASDQIAALKSSILVAPATADEVARRFRSARRDLVARHLETLALMGELHVAPDGRYAAATAVA